MKGDGREQAILFVQHGDEQSVEPRGDAQHPPGQRSAGHRRRSAGHDRAAAMGARHRPGPLLVVPWLLLLLLAPHASAVEEADAKSIDPMIAEVGHTPQVPQPGTQWEGFIRFEPGHNVTAVHYQACKVGDSCFFPPTPAQRRDNDTWGFNTSDYGPPDQNVAWGIYYPGEEPHDTWRVGVQYLVFRDGEDEVYENAELLPEGIDTASQECADLGGVACSETHYFAFDMPARAADGREAAPGPAAVLVLLGVALLAWGRR